MHIFLGLNFNGMFQSVIILATLSKWNEPLNIFPKLLFLDFHYLGFEQAAVHMVTNYLIDQTDYVKL